ncbi:unnamed protein product [Urochloa humidicola]
MAAATSGPKRRHRHRVLTSGALRPHPRPTPRAVSALPERHWARPHTLRSGIIAHSWCQRRRTSCGMRMTSLLLGTISKLQAVTVRCDDNFGLKTGILTGNAPNIAG